jgi:hypothetical protein
MDVFIQVHRHISFSLRGVPFSFLHCDERYILVDSVTASHLGGPEFRPRSSDWLPLLRFFMTLLSRPSQISG